MNAHINHDLSLALLQTNAELNLNPPLDSPEHDDFEHVNNILEALLPQTLVTLAEGHHRRDSTGHGEGRQTLGHLECAQGKRPRVGLRRSSKKTDGSQASCGVSGTGQPDRSDRPGPATAFLTITLPTS